MRSAYGLFDGGTCTDTAVARQLELVGEQVVEFAQFRRKVPSSAYTGTGVE